MGRLAESALSRHRVLTLAALLALTLLAWAWLLAGAGTGMDVQASLAPFPHRSTHGMSMAAASDPMVLFAMWWVMMVAMMLPSAAPTILIYARASRHARPGTPPPTGWFLSGYLIVWGVFSLAAAIAQWALERAGMVDAMAMGSSSALLSGAVLAAAGVYQFTPLKHACLTQCRNPVQFIARHQRPGRAGALRLGIIHGAYCVGCCWLLMAILFVGGIMNLAWIAIVTLLVAAEKVLPAGEYIARVVGIGFLLLAAFILL